MTAIVPGMIGVTMNHGTNDLAEAMTDAERAARYRSLHGKDINKQRRQHRTELRLASEKAAKAAHHADRLAEMQSIADKASTELASHYKLFPVICADPGWHFVTRSPKGMSRHASRHYRTLPTDALCRIVPPAAPDSGLFLWTLPCMTAEAMRVVAAWGFVKVSTFYWHKLDKHGECGARGHGYYSTEDQVEDCGYAGEADMWRRSRALRCRS